MKTRKRFTTGCRAQEQITAVRPLHSGNSSQGDEHADHNSDVASKMIRPKNSRVLEDREHSCPKRNGRQDCPYERPDFVAKALSPNDMPLGVLCSKKAPNGIERRILIPFDALRNANKLASHLLALRIVAPLEGRENRSLAAYIYGRAQDNSVILLDQEGWYEVQSGLEKSFIAVIGNKLLAPTKTDLPVSVLLRNAPICAVQGKFKEWQAVAKPVLANNYVFISLVSTALSAPFGRLFGLPVPSLLLAGSDSEMSALTHFANALYGPPSALSRHEKTIDALATFVIRHRDLPVAIDGITEGAAAQLMNLIVRKRRRAQEFCNERGSGPRKVDDLQTVIIACVEDTSLENDSARHRRIQRLHELGMLYIQPAREHGYISALNSRPNTAAFLREMEAASSRFYGVVGDKYTRQLFSHFAKCATFVHQRTDQYHRAIAGDAGDLTSLEEDVLARFVTCALAGEIAIRLRVLPLEQGEVLQAVKYVFAGWLYEWRSRFSTPKEMILQRLRDFFQREGDNRFTDLAIWQEWHSQGHAGFTYCHKLYGPLFLVCRAFFEQELCKPFSVGEVLLALREAGLLVSHQNERTWSQRMPRANSKDTKNRRIRFYAIKEAIRFDK